MSEDLKGKVWSEADLKAMRQMMQGFGDPAPTPKKTVDYTINFQSAFTWVAGGLIAGVIFLGGWGFQTILGYQADKIHTTETLSGFQGQLDGIKSQMTALQSDIGPMKAALLQIRDQMAAAQQVNLDQQKQIASLHEDLAVAKTEMKSYLEQQSTVDGRKASGPHGELAIPEKYGMLDPAQVAEMRDGSMRH